MVLGARNMWRGGEKFPYDAEVEYLQSDGNQYIDTGAHPTNLFTVEVRAYRTVASSSDGVLFGSRYAMQYDFSIWTNTTRGRGVAAHYGRGDGRQTEDSGWVYTENIFNEWITTLVTPQVIKVNGQHVYSWKNSMTPYASPISAYLFALRDNNGRDPRSFIGRVSKCAIYDDGVLVRDFIPVRVGSGANAVGYMYDRVSGELYRNAGTGAFVIGPDKT